MDISDSTNLFVITTTPTTPESSKSAAKNAMFDHLHHRGHKMLPVNSHSSSEKVHHKVLLPHRSHTLLEKDPKEVMAKYNHRSHSDGTSVRRSTNDNNNNNNSNIIVYMPPIWDTHGTSQQIHRKLHKFAMVKGEEGRYGRHQKKKMEHEDSLYYGEELQGPKMATVTASSTKITNVWKESIARAAIEAKGDESRESFLRGAHHPSK
jgi:hypothetical protein